MKAICFKITLLISEQRKINMKVDFILSVAMHFKVCKPNSLMLFLISPKDFRTYDMTRE